jgi:hypothetical protein
VNDRSYAASSLLAVAMADVFSTARSGRCHARQELADAAIPLEIGIPVLPCRGGPDIARRMFAPLGWTVQAEAVPLDPVEREPSVLRIGDVLRDGSAIPQENAAAAALEIMSRFAVDPRWLIWLPPTMSPVATSKSEGFLEHPQEAFEEYAKRGVARVVCEEKHMGSRAVAVIAKDEEAAARRFGVGDGTTGVVYTRTGRPFFADTTALVDRLRIAAAGLFESLATDWLALDCELLPWSAKALELIQEQYACVGAAARTVLPAARALLEQAAARGLDVGGLIERSERRLHNAEAFGDAYAAYVRPTDGLDGVTLAPFQILAAQGRVLALTEPHEWHLAQIATLSGDLITATRHRVVDLASAQERQAATQWWLDLTAAGGEGMVVKPAHPAAGRIQPGLKVRGREYLRLVYGPDYTDSLDVLRGRNLGRKRQLALREHRRGLQALAAFVAHEPLWQVHQGVFAVLALESEPVDPRL